MSPCLRLRLGKVEKDEGSSEALDLTDLSRMCTIRVWISESQLVKVGLSFAYS